MLLRRLFFSLSMHLLDKILQSPVASLELTTAVCVRVDLSLGHAESDSSSRQLTLAHPYSAPVSCSQCDLWIRADL